MEPALPLDTVEYDERVEQTGIHMLIGLIDWIVGVVLMSVLIELHIDKTID